RELSNVVHGHHIVQKVVPELFDEVKDKPLEWIMKHGNDAQKHAWFIGKTHEHLKGVCKMTDADLAIGEAGYNAAMELAKQGKTPPNLTLAINDAITHSWKTTKEVYDRMKKCISKEHADAALKKLGEKFINGDRIGHN